MTVTETIKEKLNEFTKSERAVATSVLTNQESVMFGTLDSVAAEIGVSTTSVLRFCRKLGFAGFKDMQHAIRQNGRLHAELPDKFRRTAHADGDSVLVKTLTQDMACIKDTFARLSDDVLTSAVDAVCHARRVYTFGMKESYALAHYAYTRLATVRPDVSVLQAGYNGEIESLLNLTPMDVCIVFLFHRYTNQSLHILDALQERGIPVLLVTDEQSAHFEKPHTQLLPCRVDAMGIKNTAVAPIVLCDYLCTAVALVNGEHSLQHMKDTETLFRKGNLIEDQEL